MTRRTLKKIFAPLALAFAVATPAFAQEAVPSLNAGNFSDTVNSATRPVLVEFGAPWCPICKMEKPNMEALHERKLGEVDVYQVNTDNNPSLSQQFKIRGLPTFVMLYHGKQVGRLVGGYNARDLNNWVNEVESAVTARENAKPPAP